MKGADFVIWEVEQLKYGDWDKKSFGIPAAELLEIAEWETG